MGEDANRTLRSVIFECFLCFPGHLERIIAKALGCAVHFKGILGRGSYNVVVDTVLLDQQQQQRRVALRLPQTTGSSVTLAQATSGYAATVFLSRLELPTLVAGPVCVASPPLPYMPRHFSVMQVAEGVQLFKLWKTAPLELKKTVLADLACFTLQLYRNPLSTMGGMVISSDGCPCVGAMHGNAVSLAKERGIDVGHVSPGPYSCWKEYARNQIEGYELLYGSCRRYGESIRANVTLLLTWLDEFQIPGESNKFYLHHPEFGDHQVLIDPCSGHVNCIIDWDGAKTGTIQSLGAGFFLPFYNDEEEDEEDELFEFYGQQLIQGGAPELVQYVRKRRWQRASCDPQVMFEEELGDYTWPSANSLNIRLHRLCTKMQELGLIDPADEVAPLNQRPWKSPTTTSASSSSSSSREATSASSSASSSSSSSSSREATSASCLEEEALY